MLSPQNSNKMLEVEFKKVEHTGQVMDIIRSFEREIEGYPLIGTAYWKGREYHADIEISVAYYARAKEIEMYCKKFESGIDVGKTRHPLYKFRTGQLNVFIEMCKELTKLGSRRITVAQMMLAEDVKDLP